MSGTRSTHLRNIGRISRTEVNRPPRLVQHFRSHERRDVDRPNPHRHKQTRVRVPQTRKALVEVRLQRRANPAGPQHRWSVGSFVKRRGDAPATGRANRDEVSLYIPAGYVAVLATRGPNSALTNRFREHVDADYHGLQHIPGNNHIPWSIASMSSRSPSAFANARPPGSRRSARVAFTPRRSSSFHRSAP